MSFNIKQFIGYLLSTETLAEDNPDNNEKSSDGGFISWLLKPENLDFEETPKSDGKPGFIKWLLSFDKLDEVTDPEKKAQFTEGGFFKWLLKSDELGFDDADSSDKGNKR